MSGSDSDRYDDPAVEASWLKDEHERVLAYLERQGVSHGGVPDRPDWFVAPYLAVWRVGSLKAPGAIGWWVASGDIPIDCISSEGAPGPREALVEFSEQW